MASPLATTDGSGETQAPTKFPADRGLDGVLKIKGGVGAVERGGGGLGDR